jgi:hypothetical protein
MAEIQPEELSGHESRAARLVAARPTAVDDERRECGRLVAVELGLPADPGAAGVEPALVAEDPAAHVPDSRRGHLVRERDQLCGGQRGIAVPLEDEIPQPGRPALVPFAEHVGLDAEGRAEGAQRGVGGCELLVRRGAESAGGVLGEQRAAGAEVENDRARLRRAHVPGVQRPREQLLEGVARPGLSGRDEEERDDCHHCCGEAEMHGFPFFKRLSKRQAGWVGLRSKMGRATHSRARFAAR